MPGIRKVFRGGRSRGVRLRLSCRASPAWRGVLFGVLLLAGIGCERPDTSGPSSRLTLDFFGDRLPDGAVARLGTTRLRADGNVREVYFSADDRLLTVHEYNGRAKLWDIRTRRCIRQEQVDRPRSRPRSPYAGFSDRAVSHDGLLLAVGQKDGRVEFIRLKEEPRTRRKPPGSPRHSGRAAQAPEWVVYPYRVLAVAFSPDDELLAVSTRRGSSRRSSLSLWKTRTQALAREFAVWPGEIGHVAFSPDGRVLASRDLDGTLVLWDMTTGKKVRQWETYKGKAKVRFSNNGDMLAVWGISLADRGISREIGLYDPGTGKPILDLPRHRGQVKFIAYLDEGKVILTVDRFGLARRWKADTGQPLDSFELGRRISAVAVSPDGKRLAYGVWDGKVNHGVIRVRDLTTNRDGVTMVPALGWAHTVRELHFAEDNRTLGATYSPGSRVPIEFWDAVSGKAVGKYRWSYAHFRAGRCGRRLFVTAWSARVVDAKTGKTISPSNLLINSEEDYAAPAELSPDGTMLILPLRDGGIEFIDVESAKLLYKAPLGKQVLLALAFSADGRRMCCASWWNRKPGKVVVWDLAARRVVWEKTLELSPDAIAISPNGKHVVTAGRDEEILVWPTDRARRESR